MSPVVLVDTKLSITHTNLASSKIELTRNRIIHITNGSRINISSYRINGGDGGHVVNCPILGKRISIKRMLRFFSDLVLVLKVTKDKTKKSKENTNSWGLNICPSDITFILHLKWQANTFTDVYISAELPGVFYKSPLSIKTRMSCQ